jgi:uncharacterized damage-inducible protein DinB
MLHIKLLSVFALTLPVFAQAPTSAPDFMGACSNLVCEIKNDWNRNQTMVTTVALAMPEDKYAFKPTTAQESFGERVLHVASVHVQLLKTLGAKTPVPELNFKATQKSEILDVLQRSGDYGIAVLQEFNEAQLAERVPTLPFMGGSASRQRLLYFLMMHAQDTYGQLAVYLRLNGVTPPLSRTP